MLQPTVFGRAVPMFDVRRNDHDVSGFDLANGFSFFLIVSFAENDDEDLTAARFCVVNMPIISARRLESDVISRDRLAR